MISPQNLAIAVAAVGLHGEEGTLFRRVFGWSIVLLLIMCVLVYLQSTAVLVMDGRVEGGARGPRRKSRKRRARAPRDISGLVEELKRIVGDEWVYTAEHQLRTYESDGLLQYHATPAAAVLPNSTEEVQAIVQACAREEVAWVARGAGSGLSGGALPVEDGVLLVLSPDEADPRDRPRQRPRVRRAGRHQRERVRGGRPRRSSIRPTRPRRSSARSAATSPRTPAARTASSTASRPTT